MLINLETLKSKYNLSIKGILHFGAHMAEEHDIYTKIGITNVIWFEANPNLAKALIDRFSGTSDKVYHGLISDTDGSEMTFYITNNGQSSSMLKLARHATYYPEITVSNTVSLKTKRFDTLAMEENIDSNKYNFLNLDVQGAELMVMKGFGELIKNIDYIYTEVNTEELYSGCALLEEIDEYLAQYGFKRVELSMTDKSWGDAFYVRPQRNTLITSHMMPNELLSFRRMTGDLKNASKYLESHDYVEQYYAINLSPELFDWNNSSIAMEDVEKEFNAVVAENCQWCKTTIDFIKDGSILGTTAQKRKIIRECPTHIDQLIFLDADIYFHEYMLKYMIDASKSIQNKYYVLTPQTVKLWDYTWDILTNKAFLNEEYGYYKIANPNIVYSQVVDEIDMVPINTFKFGCGWFTLYSKSLLQFVDIPDKLQHYGSEDTYIMIASSLMKEMGYDVQQYLIDGIFIMEDYIYRQTPDWRIERKISKESYYIKHDTPQFQDVINELVLRLKPPMR